MRLRLTGSRSTSEVSAKANTESPFGTPTSITRGPAADALDCLTHALQSVPPPVERARAGRCRPSPTRPVLDREVAGPALRQCPRGRPGQVGPHAGRAGRSTAAFDS